jgi:tRNA A37 threonylcarbamoyladenosine dehydratase
MNIQEIKVIDRDTIFITTTNNHVIKIKRDELTVPEKTWLDNILACSVSLINQTSQK